MKDKTVLPVWAPRVRPHLIQRLYQEDAQGILDEELLDEVGWGLHARCESFLAANQSTQGRSRCPTCGALVAHGFQSKERLHCDACGWECTWKAYYGTIQDQQLSGGPEVVALFQDFVERFPRARRPAEKMLLIDGLLHGFHHSLRSGRTRRPVGVNLIHGSLNHVIDFLDQLSCGPGSTPGLQQNKTDWRDLLGQRKRMQTGRSGGEPQR